MKLTIVLLLFFTFQVSANGYAQRVTIVKQNAHLTEIFKSIEQQTGYHFFYDRVLLKNTHPIDIAIRGATLDQALTECLKGQSLTYSVVKNTVVIRAERVINMQAQMISAHIEMPMPLPIEIRGRVVNQQGEPLQNVSVLIAGSKIGTTTDSDGRFLLTSPDNRNVVLEISSVGYQMKRVSVGKQTEINVVLEVDVAGLSDVVVVGYGTQKRVNLTGSIATVDAKSLEDRPITNSSQALQGVQGVYVNQAGGQPGADDATIRIRGIGTFNNNDPLVLVDGVEYNIRDINPNDIESISVLKDASASIYGNRAANGVILVTLKTGKKGNIKVDYNDYFGWQQATYLPDLVTNSVDWMISRNQAAINEGQPAVFSDVVLAEYKNGTDPDIYPNTDWLNIMFRQSSMQKHDVRLAGGTDKVTFSLSLGYLNQEGALIKTDAQNYSLNSNIDFKISERLKAGIILSSSYWNKEEWGRQMVGGGDGGVMGMIFRALPIHASTLADGRYGDTWLTVPGHNIFRNPLASSESSGNTRTLRGLINLFAEYSFPLNIKYKINLAANKFDALESGFIPEIFIYNPKKPDVPRPMTKDPRNASRSDINNLNTTFSQTLNWSKDIEKQHHIDLLLGSSAETFGNTNFDTYIEGFLGNELTELNAGTINKNLHGTSSESRLLSYFSRVNYRYSNKYLLEATFRYDGSSRFAKGNQWGFFPAFSIGWLLNKEPFMQSLKALNNLKLRASWGQMGNQNIPLYSYSSNIDINQGTSFNNTIAAGSAITALSDPNISWETTAIANIGLDLDLWNNKLRFTADIFDKKTTGILTPITIPGQVGGLIGPITNLYGMSNKGIEISTSYNNSFRDLKYTIGTNVAYVDNNVDFLNGAVQYTTNDYGNISVIKEGSPVNSWYLYEAIGIFQTVEEVQKHAYQDPNTAPGDIIYQDLNEDGKIDGNDMRVLGRSVPDYTYSFNLGLDYKGFKLSAFFQGVEGVDIYPWGNAAFGNYNGAGITKDQLLNSWSQDNPNAKYPRLFLPKRGSRINARNSTFWLKDASYLRLKNLQLGYNIPAKLINKINITKINIFVNAQNYLTFSKYKLTDPEKDVLQQDLYSYPSLKIISIGCNVVF